jgi:hypothetical protein
MPDAHAATELKLYIDNDGDLYRRQTTPILKNLATKRARGAYKHDLAVKAFGYLTEAGAKKYAKEFGASSQAWHKMFDVATRKQAAEALTRDFEAEAALGNYDHLLPKKYQGQKSGVQHARKKLLAVQPAQKKLQWKTPESIKVVWSPVNQAYLALWPGHGRIENQNVLKIANADEMHGWLRDTYGSEFGLAKRGEKTSRGRGVHARKKSAAPRGASQRQAHTAGRGISAQDLREFRGFLGNASDLQVQGIYEKEKRAGRDEYAELAVAEANRRGLSLDGHYNHARRKSPAQLDHEIAQMIGPRRYRS